MACKLIVLFAVLFGAVGCTAQNGTWYLSQNGTKIGTYKGIDKYVPRVVIKVVTQQNQQAVYAHRHPSSQDLQPDQCVWVVGGITEVFIAE
jgi:hypothetical protein